MSTTSAAAEQETQKQPGALRVGVQKVGSFMSGMIMPIIPALIAWGLVTAFFIDVGWTPNEALASIVGPMIHYLLPILIAVQGGKMVYDMRGRSSALLLPSVSSLARIGSYTCSTKSWLLVRTPWMRSTCLSAP